MCRTRGVLSVDAFEANVVNHPSVAALEKAVVRRHLGAVLGDDGGADSSGSPSTRSPLYMIFSPL